MAAAPEESRVFLAVLPGSRGSFPAGTGRHRRFPPALLTDRGCHLPFPAGMSTLPVSVSSGGWGSGPRGPAVRPACREPHPWAAPARRQRPSHRHRCSPRHGRAHRRSAVGPGRRPPAPSRPRPGGTGSVRRCLPGPADPRRAAPAVPGGVPGHPPRSHRDSQCGRPGAIPAPPRPAARGRLRAGPGGGAGGMGGAPSSDTSAEGAGLPAGAGLGRGTPRVCASLRGRGSAPRGERPLAGGRRPGPASGWARVRVLPEAPRGSTQLPAASRPFPALPLVPSPAAWELLPAPSRRFVDAGLPDACCKAEDSPLPARASSRALLNVKQPRVPQPAGAAASRRTSRRTSLLADPSLRLPSSRSLR